MCEVGFPKVWKSLRTRFHWFNTFVAHKTIKSPQHKVLFKDEDPASAEIEKQPDFGLSQGHLFTLLSFIQAIKFIEWVKRPILSEKLSNTLISSNRVNRTYIVLKNRRKWIVPKTESFSFLPFILELQSQTLAIPWLLCLLQLTAFSMGPPARKFSRYLKRSGATRARIQIPLEKKKKIKKNQPLLGVSSRHFKWGSSPNLVPSP